LKQKDIFLQSEGNEWFQRNINDLEKLTLPNDDSVLVDILNSPIANEEKLKVLEIGCGNGHRLKWLQENKNYTCYGIDPSAKAIVVTKNSGVNAAVGTADKLQFEDDLFDVVIFGFCLYLCDREDLFSIAQQADRVLKRSGWIVIRDFFTKTTAINKYHHKDGIFSHKMDYSSMFTWNPAYTLFSQRIDCHDRHADVDNAQEWVASSIIRKSLE
jgi:ubiquinone/menaquinone biosynthesis C-methylase UbiE